ncbi:unnamed protein product [Closterium sp. Naga37s-1]|nr:unnamed protein product [Closterium sp. Naga37s-1]
MLAPLPACPPLIRPSQITQKRQSLPIMAYREEITRAIERHQVVLIVGETGCGKTTQVPQFILDHEWGKGRRCRVLCTQPRRISATSVAERIAAERGEKIGQTVGYQIRLESKGNRSSSLWLCTNGVLLRCLVGLGAHLTHVIKRIAAERGEKIGQTVGYQIRLESKGNRSSSLWMCTNGVLLRHLVGLSGLPSLPPALLARPSITVSSPPFPPVPVSPLPSPPLPSTSGGEDSSGERGEDRANGGVSDPAGV